MNDKVRYDWGGRRAGRTYAHIVTLKLLLDAGEIDILPIHDKRILDFCIECGIKPSQIKFRSENESTQH